MSSAQDGSPAAHLLLRVAALASNPLTLEVAAAIQGNLVGAALVGYERPTGSSLQGLGSTQTRILSPGAEGMIVAERDHILPHVAAAIAARSPFEGYLRSASPDLVAAVKYTCSFARNPELLVGDRMQRLETWSRHAAALGPLHQQLQGLQSPASSRLMCGGAAPLLIEAAIQAIGWPDRLFTAHRALGFPTWGEYPDCGIFRPCERPATRSYPDLPPDHNRMLVKRLRAKWRDADVSQRETMSKVTEKTRAETLKGLSDGPFTFEEMEAIAEKTGTGWHALERFGVAQGQEPDGSCKVRPCDNAKSSGTNECLTTHETISCESASFPSLVASLFYELLPPELRALVRLVHSTDDVEAAYRRMAALDQGSTVVAIYDTVEGDVRFYTMPGHNFGLSAAVLSWNRHSHLIATLARRCFGIPCGAYFDDYDICGPDWAAASAKVVLRQLHLWLGVPLAEGLKDVPPREINPFLGVVTDLSQFRQGIVFMQSKPERIAKLIDSIERYLEHGIPSAEARHFFGKLEFVRSSATAGRIGRAAIGILRRATGAGGQSGALDESVTAAVVREALIFLYFLLPRIPRRRFHFCGDRHSRPPIALYTDAMYEAKAAQPARIGVALYDPLDTESRWRDLSIEVPARIIAGWAKREQYITQLETLAPLVAILSRPGQFRGRDVICFVDNTGALFGLGKGDCKDADCARLIHIFHTLCLALDISVWFEYVASGANLADLPSRGDRELLIEMGSTPFSHVEWPDLAADLSRSFQSIWERFAPRPSTGDKRRRAAIDRAVSAVRGEVPRPLPRNGPPRKRARARAFTEHRAR